MTTIRTKFRPSSVPGRMGTVVYRIIHRRMVRNVSSTVSISAEDWERLLKGEEDGSLADIRTEIECGVTLIEDIAGNLEREHRPYTAEDVARIFRESGKSSGFIRYIRASGMKMKEEGRHSTAHNYLSAANSLAVFLGGKDIPVCAVTARLMEHYGRWLTGRGVCRNSLSFYMRVLRAAYNKAVSEGLARQAGPFRNVYTGIERTAKRAVSEETVSSLYRTRLRENSPLSMARDLFLFSYCARGMAFVDMAHLRKSDISRGILSYRRHKTGQRIEVRMEGPMDTIAQRYLNKDSPYVFPILRDGSNGAVSYRRYRTMLRYYNRLLGRLSVMSGSGCHLTSYVARHTWASAARAHGVSLSIISAAMGHTSERTTSIYLADIDRSLIDNVNREIIGKLERGVSL